MKKKMMTCILAGCMVFSLFGCGGGNQAADSGSSTNEAAGSTGAGENTAAGESPDELTVVCWDRNFNIYAMEAAGKLYQEAHPEFKLNVIEGNGADMEMKVTTAASSGDYSTLPDIFLMEDTKIQKNLANFPGVFVDISDSGVDFGSFAEAKTSYSVYEDKNYGVPFDNGAAITCLRTDYLAEAGLTPEDFNDITWEQFIEYGKKVKEATNMPLLTSQAGKPDLLMIMLQSCGSSMLNEGDEVNIVGNEALKRSMEIYKEMVEAGVLQEVTDWEQYIASINNGTVAGVINGCWIMASVQAAEDQSGKWAITNIPKIDGVEGATNYSNQGGSTWLITANCKNKELAYDFLSETFAGSVILYETILPPTGAIATYLPAGESDVYEQGQAFFNDQPVYLNITEYAAKVPSCYTGKYYSDAKEALGVAINNVIQNNADIDAEIKSMQDTVEFNMGY